MIPSFTRHDVGPMHATTAGQVIIAVSGGGVIIVDAADARYLAAKLVFMAEEADRAKRTRDAATSR